MRAAVLAVLAALAVLPGTPAHAEPIVDGQMCGAVFTVEGAFVADAGPLVVVDGAEPVPVTLVCTLQVWPDVTHAGADLASASVSGTNVVALPPTPLTYEPSETFDYRLCTQLVVGTSRLYWDAVSGGGANEFSTSPDSACATTWCQDSIPSNCDPPRCGERIHLNCHFLPTWDELFVEYVDPAVCPVLGGDVPGLWDCPPYEE